MSSTLLHFFFFTIEKRKFAINIKTILLFITSEELLFSLAAQYIKLQAARVYKIDEKVSTAHPTPAQDLEINQFLISSLSLLSDER